jgi:hypothetical protein
MSELDVIVIHVRAEQAAEYEAGGASRRLTGNGGGSRY